MFLVGGKTVCWSYEQAKEIASKIHEQFGIIVSIEEVEAVGS